MSNPLMRIDASVEFCLSNDLHGDEIYASLVHMLEVDKQQYAVVTIHDKYYLLKIVVEDDEELLREIEQEEFARVQEAFLQQYNLST